MLKYLPLLKPAERNRVNVATFLILEDTLAFVVFSREVAVLCLLFVSVGDPAAALIGSRSRRARIWGKSLSGTLAFAATAGAVGVLTALHPAVPLAWWMAAGVVVAALVELLPLPVDDNFTVPLAAGGVMAVLA